MKKKMEKNPDDIPTSPPSEKLSTPPPPPKISPPDISPPIDIPPSHKLFSYENINY